jgi:regulator of protease activity HflC (stomatin/prohibitin superfamily)
MKPNPESLDGKSPPKRYRWWRFIEHSLPVIVIYLMVATLVSFLIAPNVIVTVPTGHVGILWKRFRGGTQLDPRLLKDEGMRVLLPWDKLFLYDLRLQTHDDTYNAISKDGVYLTTTINIRFRLKHDAVPQLHQTIGPDYVKRMLSPEIGNRAREIFAEYTAEEIYSTKRQEIQKKIRTHTEAMLGQSSFSRTEQESEYGEHYKVSLDEMLIIYDTLVLGLELPAAVNAAINRKIEQYYLVQEYGFRVEREKKESERKQIEANGIRDFQQTVTQGISDSYVRWRGIEATLQLAQSPNTKIVIIGSGKDGLPVILGNVDTPMQPNPAAPAGAPAAAALPDNSEAARQRPAGASPPFVEKTPASNLPSPAERPSPTGAPRATPSGSSSSATTPSATTSSEGAPSNTTSAPAKQESGAPASEPRTSWTWSEIQDLISRTVGSGAPAPESRPPATGPGAAGPPGAGTGPGGAGSVGASPGTGSAPRPAAGPPQPQAEGPPPPRADRGSPRPPEQPRQ